MSSMRRSFRKTAPPTKRKCKLWVAANVTPVFPYTSTLHHWHLTEPWPIPLIALTEQGPYTCHFDVSNEWKITQTCLWRHTTRSPHVDRVMTNNIDSLTQVIFHWPSLQVIQAKRLQFIFQRVMPYYLMVVCLQLCQ